MKPSTDTNNAPETSNANTGDSAPSSDKGGLTNAAYETLRANAATLHPLVANRGTWAPLPSFDKCGDEEISFIYARAAKLFVLKGIEMRAEQSSGVKAAVDAVVATHATMLNTQRAKLATIIEANPDLATTITLPAATRIPLFALMPCFPEGTAETTAVMILKDLGHTVSNGNGKGKERGEFYVLHAWVDPTAVAKVA